MNKTKPNPVIYEYLDYRQYLGDYCASQKAQDINFSNRYFARKAGLPNSNASLLSKIIGGKRNLSMTQRFKFAKGLDLTNDELKYFDILVQFNQAENVEAKNHFFHELSHYRGSRAKVLPTAEFHYYAKWYFSVVRAYLGLNPNERNPAIIARRLIPQITSEQVQEALQVLLDLKLIKKLANGYAVTDKHITTEKGAHGEANKKRTLDMIHLAIDVFDKVPVESREYNAITVYVSEKGYKSMQERIRSFREELRELVEKDSQEDRVYTLNLQLFPNTVLPESSN